MQARTETRPLAFDPLPARAAYLRDGYVLLPAAVPPQLLDVLTSQVGALTGSGADLARWRYPDKKSQYLWELPPGLELGALCAQVAEATGLDPARTLLAERHVKVYSAHASPMPPAHKDRGASQVSLGIGIDVPACSRLVLWPDADRAPNAFPTAAEWRNSLAPFELPELALAHRAPVVLDVRRGDVVLFQGSSVLHERFAASCATMLYLKFNDLGLDPLGEDPRTPAAEERSRALCHRGLPADARLWLSARVVGLRTDELRPDRGRRRYARVLGREPGVPVSEPQARLLRAAMAGSPLVLAALGPAQRRAAGELVRAGLLLAAAPTEDVAPA